MAPITLFASGYGGTIYTLEFTEGAGLKVLHEQAAGKAPTWVELSENDKTGKLLYTGDEFSPVGNASVYKIKDDGSLELFGKKETGKGATGPVHFAVSRVSTQAPYFHTISCFILSSRAGRRLARRRRASPSTTRPSSRPELLRPPAHSNELE